MCVNITISRLWQVLNQTGSALDRLEVVGHASLLNIRISNLRDRTGFVNAELFVQKYLMLGQLCPRYTDMCVFVAFRIWILRYWRRNWFSDEARFLPQKCDGRIVVNRRQNERFGPVCVREVNIFGDESVMI